jgi:hypothetical protein
MANNETYRTLLLLLVLRRFGYDLATRLLCPVCDRTAVATDWLLGAEDDWDEMGIACCYCETAFRVSEKSLLDQKQREIRWVGYCGMSEAEWEHWNAVGEQDCGVSAEAIAREIMVHLAEHGPQDRVVLREYAGQIILPRLRAAREAGEIG